MVTIQGNASRAITGGDGLDIPLEPAAITAAQAELRQQRQIAAIEAAEAAATRAAQQAPLPHRRRRGAQAVSQPVAVPRPAPAPEPEVLTEPVEPTPVPPVAAKPEVMPGFDTTAPAQVRQLKTELAMAGQRISALLAQVEEQGACIAGALVDLQRATSMATQLSELATEQQDLLRARAETAERDLIAAHRQIDSLIGELATAATSHESDQPVLCLGAGCDLPVAPEYVARTGFLWHGPCKDRVPSAAARFSGRRVA